MSGWLRDPGLRPTLILAAMCVLLSIAAVMAWFWRPAPNVTRGVVVAGGGEENADKGNEPPQVFHLPPIEQYSDMAERPLFNKERRPREDAPKVDKPAGGPANPKALRLSLTSVVIAPGRKLAIFRDLAKNKSLRAAEGEVVKGWRLAKIHGDKVELVREGKSHELLLRAPKPKSARAKRDKQKKGGRKSRDQRKPARGGPAMRQDNQ